MDNENINLINNMRDSAPKKPIISQKVKTISLIVIGAIVLIAVVYFGIKQYGVYSQSKQFKSVTSATLPEGYKYNVQKADQYPEGFPILIVVREGNPLWQRGEDTKVGTGERQRIVELLYTLDSTKIASLYEANMAKDGWKSTSDETMKKSGLYYYTKKADTFSIMIVPKGTGSFVNLKYSTKI